MTTEKKKPNNALKIAVIVAVILGGGIWLWEDVLKDRIIPKRWGVVEAGRIYRSGQLSSALVKKTLERNGIKVIVDMTSEVPGDPDQEAEKQAAAELGIERTKFPLAGNGTGDIAQYIGALSALVEAREANKPVLVHCAAGSQRTGGAIAFYRLLVEKKPPEFVVKEMRRYDWRLNDNPALPAYVNEHMAEMAAALKDRGILDEVPDPLPLLPTAP